MTDPQPHHHPLGPMPSFGATMLMYLVSCATLGSAPVILGSEDEESDVDTDTDADSDVDSDTDTDSDSGVDPETTDDDDDGWTENDGDCNDADASIHPGAEDIQNNGVDEDCSGDDWITSGDTGVVLYDCDDLGLAFTAPSSWSGLDPALTCTPDVNGRGAWVNDGVKNTNYWSFANGSAHKVRCEGQIGSWVDKDGNSLALASVAWECETSDDPVGCTAARPAQDGDGCDGWYEPD